MRNSAVPLKVLAIAGSIRTGSLNRRLLEAAAELAPAGMSLSIADLELIPLFSEDLEHAGAPGFDAVQRLRAEVAQADGVLIATPEYNQSIPGVLKNAIDWLSRPLPEEVLAGKPVAVIGASAGRWGMRLAQAATRQVLYATESLVLPRPALYLREATALFDAQGGLMDATTRESLAELLRAFARWIELLPETRAADQVLAAEG
jgi:chromate reductase, NAD(P)H dehydrogenase (quinone)